jgi:hypothetical protein
MTKSRIYIDEEEFDPPDWFIGKEKDMIEQITSSIINTIYIVLVLLYGSISIIGLGVFIKRKKSEIPE